MELNYTILNFDEQNTLPVTAELSSAPENLNVTLTSNLYNGTTTSQNTTTLTANAQTKVADVPYAGKTSFDDLLDAFGKLTLDRNNAEDMDTLYGMKDAYCEFIDLCSYDPFETFYNFVNGDYTTNGEYIIDDIKMLVDDGYYYTAFFETTLLYMNIFSMLQNREILDLSNNQIDYYNGGVDVEFHLQENDYFIYVNGAFPIFNLNRVIGGLPLCDINTFFQGCVFSYSNPHGDIAEGEFYLSPGNPLNEQFRDYFLESNSFPDCRQEDVCAAICDIVDGFIENIFNPNVDFIDNFGPQVISMDIFNLGLTPFFEGASIEKSTLYNPQKLFDFCKSNNLPCLLITIRLDIADTSSPASFDGKIHIILGAV